jgi:tRNA-dihydrouridine synthase
MEDVTDTVFRRIVLEAGAPDLFFTEFTSTDGLCSAGRPRVIGRLRYTLRERPLIAQIWGTRPELFRRVAADVREMEFDGVDINMGCPVRKIVSRGACGALIGSPSQAAEIIAATREGAAGLPVSVKTRLGVTSPRGAEEWISFLLRQGIAALTVHGRTVAQQSEGTADWNAIAMAVRLRNEAGVPTRIVGNGDVKSVDAFFARATQAGVEGIMIGRGVFENLHLFTAIRARRDGTPDPRVDFSSLASAAKVEAFRRHMILHRDTWGPGKQFDVLKKFAKTYLRSFEGASRLTDAVMHTRTHEAGLAVLDEWLARDAGLSSGARAAGS